MPELQQISVMVTRPAHQAEGLCRLIEQFGGRAIRLPVIEIAAVEDETVVRATLAGLADFDIVVFISANAVHRCYLYIGQSLPAGPQIATVGKATARQLQEDFRRSADLLPTEGYNSEALLALPALQQVKDKRILILKGEGGRNLLADTLADRGARVSYANLYRRMIPARAEQQLTALKRDKDVDVIVLTSGEGITNLLSLVSKAACTWLCNKSWLVIHPRLAEVARQAGCKNEIMISDGPDDESIVQCLRQWARQKTNS